jgi:hypothetical protein
LWTRGDRHGLPGVGAHVIVRALRHGLGHLPGLLCSGGQLRPGLVQSLCHALPNRFRGITALFAELLQQCFGLRDDSIQFLDGRIDLGLEFRLVGG